MYVQQYDIVCIDVTSAKQSTLGNPETLLMWILNSSILNAPKGMLVVNVHFCKSDCCIRVHMKQCNDTILMKFLVNT